PAPAYTVFNGQTIYETKDQYLARVSGHELALTLPHVWTRGSDGSFQEAGYVTDVTHLYKPRSDNDYNLLSLLSFDVTSSQTGPAGSTSAYGGYGSVVYASANHFYVVTPDWSNTWSSVGSSNILQFDLNGANVDLAATGVVPGQVLNQFSMDEQGN